MYLLLITAEPCGGEDCVAGLLGTYSYQSSTIKLTRGDYAPLMQRMIENLEKETNHLFRELKEEDKKNAREIRNMQE